MGLAPDLFWSLSLFEFNFLVERYCEVQRRRHDRPAALICAVLAELQRDPKVRQDPFLVTDFLPEASSEGRPEPIPPEQLFFDRAMSMVASFGGQVTLPDRLDFVRPDGSLIEVKRE